MSQQDTFIGKQIGNFILQEQIGRGALATVYRAFQPSTSRNVALKVIRLGKAADTANIAERFDYEVKRIAALEHIHILPVYDYGIDEDTAYIAMRLVRGGTLENQLQNGTPLDLNQISHIFTQIARGLEYAHQNNVIHRDLKPNNILMDDSGNAFLTDFGLARRILGDDVVSSREMQIFTPAYMSPEQLRGEPLTEQSDIYSLGILLYRMSTGGLPFSTEGAPATVLQRHLNEQPRPPRDVHSDIPPGLQKVIMQAIDKDPRKRFNSAEEMLKAFNDVLGSLFEGVYIPSIHTSRIETSAEEVQQGAQESTSGRTLAIAILSITAVFVIAALGILLWRNPVPAPTIRDATGIAAEIVPSEQIIRNAQRNLGRDGFIAYIACDRAEPFYATRAREMREIADSYGVNFQIFDSQGSPSREIAMIEQAHADGARVIIHCPVGESTANESLNDAINTGIPVVLSGDELAESVDGIVVTDNDYELGFDAGEAAGQYIIDQLEGSANVIILEYFRQFGSADRGDGLEAGLLSVVPDVNLLGRYGSPTQTAEEMVRSLFETEDIDVILSVTDRGAYGATLALEGMSVPRSDVAIFSINAEQIARDYIDRGSYLRGSANPDRLGGSKALMDMAVNLLGGGTIPRTVEFAPGEIYTGASS